MIRRKIPACIWAYFIFLIFYTSSSAQDYSGYEIAKKYNKEHNYLLTYKYLVIFKTTNLGRLNKSENAESLRALDAQISKLEDLLSQNINWYQLKKVRGWSDIVLLDSLKTRNRQFQFEAITIK